VAVRREKNFLLNGVKEKPEGEVDETRRHKEEKRIIDKEAQHPQG